MISIRPEVELLLCCARTIVEPDMAGRIQILVRQHIDWTYLIQIATYHRLTPLLYYNLCETAPEDCPTTILDKLRCLAHANAVRNIFLTQELIKLLNLFEAHEILVIPYKGPILAAVVYRNLALRLFDDLDILVHKWDYHFTVSELLAAHGWRLRSDYGWERSFVDATGRIGLDVHEGITHRVMPFRLSFDRVWKRCVTVSISGINVRTFTPSDLLIILCVQMAKDVAAHQIQLNKICDIAELVRSHQDIHWPWVLQEARRLGALGMLHVGLRTTTELLGIALPKEILQKNQAVHNLSSLVTHVRECVLGGTESGYSRPELLHAPRFLSEVRERVQDRVNHKYASLITTNIYDYSFVRLPRELFLLYYIVRPIRLIYKYGRILFRRIFELAIDA
jgi:hypothetical protein